MQVKKIIVIVFFTLLPLLTFSQLRFVRNDSIIVTSGLDTLKNAWTGGLNSCQFSEIDLDGDGIQDLFVFDRQGTYPAGRVSTFLNKGTPNKVSYVNAPQYVGCFPFLHDWALLADYNCDGKADIFTENNGCITLYKNTSTPGVLSFQLVTPIVYSNYGQSGLLNLYVSSVDIPVVTDVDGDGDLDIVTYAISGAMAEFHKNMTMETYGTCDSLMFVKQDQCFGHYYDDAGCTGYIRQNYPSCPVNIAPPPADTTGRIQHSGTCLLCIQEQGNKTKDLLIGHISCNNITQQKNIGDSANAQFSGVDYSFPSYNISVNMSVFACGFLVDVNNDHKKDLLVSPNQTGASENFNSVAWYNNIGTADSMVLHLEQNNFLQDNMIDVGEGAYPVLHDYDGDGLPDLFIGNFGYFTSGGLVSKIALFKNVGTAGHPKFNLVTRDFDSLSVKNLGFTEFAFTFGDLDNDGDADMIIGDYNGQFYYFEKTPGPPDQFTYRPNFFSGLHVGGCATPQLIDLNRDGKLDIVSGNRTGTIYYFQNKGTPTVPSFSSTATNTALGGINVRKPSHAAGYSTPFFYSEAGAYKLLLGMETGQVYKYDHIEGNLSGNFNLLDADVSRTAEGYCSVPFGCDINNDGIMDLFLGNYAGGVEFFQGDNTVGILSQHAIPAFNIGLYPNPAQNSFTLQINGFLADEKYILQITDLSGRILNESHLSGNSNLISSSAFPAGLYICSVHSASGAAVHQKLVIRR
ncbi:MAG TPA: FG-GAP-like repeat-containing protein [Bacteroidia bacterium]|jgi:hypothetical protein|nr:FG-GAP-like repeat-containing protein [Bacteroidia bacterium]